MGREYEFLKHLKEIEAVKKERELIKQIHPDFGFGCRINEQILFNENIRLSIQASDGHHCKPRKFLDDLSQYLAFEIALIVNDEFSSIGSVLEFEDNEQECDIYPYFSIEMVENIFQLLKEKYGLMEWLINENIC